MEIGEYLFYYFQCGQPNFHYNKTPNYFETKIKLVGTRSGLGLGIGLGLSLESKK